MGRKSPAPASPLPPSPGSAAAEPILLPPATPPEATGAGRDEEGASALGGGAAFGDFGDDGSVDSDYDYADSAFEGLGNALLSGALQLAKVYGQEEPPVAEDELEWETRHFTVFDSGRVCHFDDFVEGAPVGDRGLIDLVTVAGCEKVAGVDTFVCKGANKVYMFKLDGELDEEQMRTWVNTLGRAITDAHANAARIEAEQAAQAPAD